MNKKNQVAIVSVGSELTQGFTQNTNEIFLSRELRILGFEVALQLTIPDNAEFFSVFVKKTIQSGIKNILITGGLGPTADDKTRTFLANLAEVSLKYDPEAENSIQEYFEKTKRIYPKENKIQAYIPESATWIKNFNGTAPGICMVVKGCRIFAMPGVPAEMKSMFLTHIRPYFESQKAGDFFSKEFLLLDIHEPDLQKILDNIAFPEDVQWSSLPEEDGIHFRLYTSRADSLNLATQLFKKAFSENTTAIIVNESGDSLANSLVKFLKERHLTLSSAESCTGGLFASEIVSVPGSSDVFNGSVVSYTNQVKNELLNVQKESLEKFSAVSAEVVEEMAKGVLKQCKSAVSVATSGIAGPGGGTKETPVGFICFAIADKDKTISFSKNFSGTRNEIRKKSVFYLMSQLFVYLSKKYSK